MMKDTPSLIEQNKSENGRFFNYSLSAEKAPLCFVAGSSPHPLRGVNTPNFRTTPPRLQGERRERGGKGRGQKGREGLVDTPHVPNPEKYPFCGLL